MLNRKLGTTVAVAAAFLVGWAGLSTSLASSGGALINPISYSEAEPLDQTSEAQIAIIYNGTSLSIAPATDVANSNGDWHITTHKAHRQFITFSYPTPACSNLAITLENKQNSEADSIFDNKLEKYNASDATHKYFRLHNKNKKEEKYRFNITLDCGGKILTLDPVIENTGERR